MAITLSSLIPTRDEGDVLLTSSLQFTLTSDGPDIVDYTFKINDIETDINAIVGVGPVVNFVRSLADLEYGQRYVCSITALDEDDLEFSDSFAFIAEEGIFLNSNPRDYSYYQMTQELANFLPEETKARYDRYSNFQQLMNKFGGQTEEFENALFKQLSSYFVQTTNLNDLATLYRVELPGNFTFETTLLDDGTPLFKPPVLYGQTGIHKFELDAGFSNDMSDFYYNKLPDRYSCETTAFGSSEILAETSITNEVVNLDIDLERPGGFILELIDCNKFASVESSSNLRLLSCRIQGTSIFDKTIEEVITFIQNGVSYSKKNWNTITSVEFEDLPEDFSGSFRIDHFPTKNGLLNDFYKYSDLETTNFISWQLDEGPFGSVLQTWIDPTTDILDKLRDSSRLLVRETELYDVDNETPLELIDFVIDEFGKFIYAVDDSYLYVFNKQEEYPTGLSILTQATPDPLTVLEVQFDNLRREVGGKTASFRASQMTFGKRVAFYRYKLIKPDGSITYLTSTGVDTAANTFIPVSSSSSNFRSNLITYDFLLAGDYYLMLETRYQDGTIDKDIKLLRVSKKSALIKYSLAKFLTVSPDRLFFDFDQKLKLIDTDLNLHVVTFHRDNLLIDYDDKILYLNENYDKVIVND